MTTERPRCTNCGNAGWVSYHVPGPMIDGVLHIRERIGPCHLCNAGGSWSKWAQKVVTGAKCCCWKCYEERGESPMHMILCPTCGNKRCPKANDHNNACTNCNDPGQPGSAYA